MSRDEVQEAQLPVKISAAFRLVEILGPYTRASTTRELGGETSTEGRALDSYERGAHNAALGLLRNWLNGEVELGQGREEECGVGVIAEEPEVGEA